MKKLSLFFSALFSVSAIFGAEHIVKSPNGKLEAVVSDTNGVLTFGVNADGKSLIPSFEIGLKTSHGEVGKDAKLEVVDFNRIENKIENKFGIRSIVLSLHRVSGCMFAHTMTPLRIDFKRVWVIQTSLLRMKNSRSLFQILTR